MTTRRPSLAERLAEHPSIINTADDCGCGNRWLADDVLAAIADVGGAVHDSNMDSSKRALLQATGDASELRARAVAWAEGNGLSLLAEHGDVSGCDEEGYVMHFKSDPRDILVGAYLKLVDRKATSPRVQYGATSIAERPDLAISLATREAAVAMVERAISSGVSPRAAVTQRSPSGTWVLASGGE